MMNEKDLRVIKTEQHIEQAFLQLLQCKPYRAITVQDILEKALINRSTFYRHYASKEALAESMIATFRTRYENFLTARFNLPTSESLLAFLDEFLAFIYNERCKIIALWQIKTDTIHLYDDMYELIKGQYIAHAQRQMRPGNLDYQGHMYANIVLTNLTYALQSNHAFTINEIRQELLLMMTTAKMKG